MIITSDLHLTDRERDAYRWDFFPWLAKQLRRGHHDALLILGDLTDAKDGHSAELVNRIIEVLLMMPAEVYILKGNHDYVEAKQPFFGFLNFENLTFFSKPGFVDVEGVTTLMLPHTRTPADDWPRVVEEWEGEEPELVCCHQTFDGADAGGGYRLQGGIGANYFRDVVHTDALIIAGDIHVPQKCGGVTYVGTPYPVTFGDSHQPRVLDVVKDEGGLRTLECSPIKVPSIRKLNVGLDSGGELGSRKLAKGDQIKVKVSLPRSEFANWAAHRQKVLALAEERGVRVHSVELVERAEKRASKPASGTRPSIGVQSSEQVLDAFCEHRGLPEALGEVGAELLQEVERWD